jgi:hypothetical protein
MQQTSDLDSTILEFRGQLKRLRGAIGWTLLSLSKLRV